ncbi:MAG: hypothetical protein KDC46_10095 [Thermoleophilia bacterium]|nr:hypothetical protein [Thermoleophilia bacterium]
MPILPPIHVTFSDASVDVMLGLKTASRELRRSSLEIVTAPTPAAVRTALKSGNMGAANGIRQAREGLAAMQLVPDGATGSKVGRLTPGQADEWNRALGSLQHRLFSSAGRAGSHDVEVSASLVLDLGEVRELVRQVDERVIAWP